MDVTDATFEADVLERSTRVTVVVDLWASWCGPCKVLGPILEKVVAETPGAELAKIDIDSNPRSAATFQVQSIPAVFAIKDRKVVDSFIGALPEAAVCQWIAGVVHPRSEADRLVDAGDEESLRKALELEPGHEGAILNLSRLLVERASASTPDSGGGHAGAVGRKQPDAEEALALLARLPETPETRHLAARARLLAAGEGGDSTDVEAKLDSLLERVRDDEAARQEFVDLLEVLGPDDPKTARYRKELSLRIF
jgi:putative thioredoxin